MNLSNLEEVRWDIKQRFPERCNRAAARVQKTLEKESGLHLQVSFSDIFEDFLSGKRMRDILEKHKVKLPVIQFCILHSCNLLSPDYDHVEQLVNLQISEEKLKPKPGKTFAKQREARKANNKQLIKKCMAAQKREVEALHDSNKIDIYWFPPYLLTALTVAYKTAGEEKVYLTPAYKPDQRYEWLLVGLYPEFNELLNQHIGWKTPSHRQAYVLVHRIRQHDRCESAPVILVTRGLHDARYGVVWIREDLGKVLKKSEHIKNLDF